MHHYAEGEGLFEVVVVDGLDGFLDGFYVAAHVAGWVVVHLGVGDQVVGG